MVKVTIEIDEWFPCLSIKKTDPEDTPSQLMATGQMTERKFMEFQKDYKDFQKAQARLRRYFNRFTKKEIETRKKKG